MPLTKELVADFAEKMIPFLDFEINDNREQLARRLIEATKLTRELVQATREKGE